jgi:CheY-like chemotaxis protein
VARTASRQVTRKTIAVILIVDDVSGVSVAFGRVLHNAGVMFQTEESLAEATAALSAGRWTGFILDIFLPDGTGVDLLDTIRLQPEYEFTPVAVITADVLLDDALVKRIHAGRATLYCGAFDRTAIEAICVDLLAGPRSVRETR